jgi:hypothetical protein
MWDGSKVKTWGYEEGNLMESGPLGLCSMGQKLSFLDKLYVRRAAA